MSGDAMTANYTKTAFLFPGQGAQYPGMALDLLETGGKEVAALFDLASDVMGRDMEALLRDSDAEVLKRSDVAQPAITLANLAAAALLRGRGVFASAAAGFSLGEYAALVCAGVIDAESCFRLVMIRGKAMQEAAESPGVSGGGMAAVLGLSPAEVESLIARWTGEGLEGLYGANYNSPKQVVISGTGAALAAAAEKFRAAGARRVIPLQVAGPFHSPLMSAAAEVFAPALEEAVFADPTVSLYSNVSGKEILSGTEAKELALRHITEPVRWTEAEGELNRRGNLAAVLEAGPGKVLQGLWKDSGSGIPCYAAGTAEEIGALMLPEEMA